MTENELLELLAAEMAKPEPVRNDEVTVSMLAAKAGIGLDAAKRRLDKMVKEGKLEARRAIRTDGKKVTAYRKKE